MNFLITPCKLLYSVHICYLTGDASAPSTTHEAEIDKRVAEYLEMEDPDIVIDLREHNCSTSDKFSLFWELTFRKLLQCTNTGMIKSHI